MAKKISKVSLIAFCFVCLIVLSTYSKSYANVTCVVKVESVYMVTPATTHTGVLVALRNTTGTTIPTTTWANNTVRSFFVSKPLGNSGLAILLTALSIKTKVTANIAGTADNGSLIAFVAVTQIPQ